MRRSRLRGWGLMAIALCVGPAARAQEVRTPAEAPGNHDAAPTESGGTGKAGHAAVSRASPKKGGAEPAAPAAAGEAAPAPTVPTPALPKAPAAAPVSAPRAADPTEGDRTALINQDVAQHPPQTSIASRDPSHLQTTKMKLGGLLDRSVHSLENSEVGRVIDVMTGDDGKPAALELDVGGFLGVGNRRIAVAWSLFDLSRTGQNDPLRVALSAAQVRSAPAMDDSGETPVVTGASPIAAVPPAQPAGPAPAPAAQVPALPANAPPITPPTTSTVAPAPPAATAAPSPPAQHGSGGKPSTGSSDSVAKSSHAGPARKADHEAAVPPPSHDGDERF